MRIALPFVVTLALLPAAAQASAVKVVVEPPDRGPWAGIEYTAAPGETNRVDFLEVNDTTVRVVDPGAVIAPGAGCTATNAHTVVCTTAGFANEGLIFSNVTLGDMNDTINSHATGLTADGGPGDDRLESSSLVSGTLNGGGGHDVLLGGANEDTLIDGDRTGAVDSDVMDGRKGGAAVSYEGRTAPVRVDLTTLAPAGEPGEGDVLRSITSATGGAGNDVLRGSDRRNVIDGGPGDDRVFALGGQDFVSGGPGADRLSSGSGDDSAYGEVGDDRLLNRSGRRLLSDNEPTDVTIAFRGRNVPRHPYTITLP